jgi:predicted RNase H-like HicB family nuclease
MEKLFYPAIFHTAEEGGFWISFPDLPECLTQGDNMSDAYQMAVDALGLAISSRSEAKEEIPPSTSLLDIETSNGDFVAIVEFDMLEYKKKHNNRAVKKTLSIPEWLNEAAINAGVNFSQVLQEALVQKIGL